MDAIRAVVREGFEMRHKERSVQFLRSRRRSGRPALRRLRFEAFELRLALHGDGDGGLGDEPGMMLPDRILWQDELLGFNHLSYIESHPETGHTLMRFTTAVPNVGDGPLMVRGAETTEQGQQVFQVIDKMDGSQVEKEAGFFVFHEGHDHIHLDEYAIYNLRKSRPKVEWGMW